MIILVANSQYLSRYGAPESPEDLKRFRSVVFVEYPCSHGNLALDRT